MIALAGVGLNAALGWWWADPVVALAMVPIMASFDLAVGPRGVQGPISSQPEWLESTCW